MQKIIITIILVDIEILIIETIIFEFENMMIICSACLSQKHFVTENFVLNFVNLALKKYKNWSERKCSNVK